MTSRFFGDLCLDSNECENDPCNADQECINTYGSFECQCGPGYWAIGPNCVDLDECASVQLNQCPDRSDCDNTVGSYICTCQDGFEGDMKGRVEHFALLE